MKGYIKIEDYFYKLSLERGGRRGVEGGEVAALAFGAFGFADDAGKDCFAGHAKQFLVLFEAFCQ